jgi:hypothetical protein
MAAINLNPDHLPSSRKTFLYIGVQWVKRKKKSKKKKKKKFQPVHRWP